MNTVYITIGRNVGDNSALTLDLWEEFKSRVIIALRHELQDIARAGDVVIEAHEGIGTYDGIREESTIISARWSDSEQPLQRNYLKGHLSYLAEKYGQECIALSFGTSELVFA